MKWHIFGTSGRSKAYLKTVCKGGSRGFGMKINLKVKYKWLNFTLKRLEVVSMNTHYTIHIHHDIFGPS